jgi:peptidoglycan/xylan/chitin deacetylase (PgdA/CDA1 family)
VLTPFQLDTVLDIHDREQARESIMTLVRRKKRDPSWEPDSAVRAISGLVTDVFEGTEIDRFIDWTQATEMMRDGVTFGSHGESHRQLTTLTPEDVSREVHTSRSSLEQQLGTRPAMFCYPNGDWNGSVARLVGEQFALAFATGRGHVDPKRENRLAIRRINVHEDMTGTEPLLLARILGII